MAKTEKFLKACIKNLVNKGFTVEEAKMEMVNRFPEDEGMIYFININEDNRKVAMDDAELEQLFNIDDSEDHSEDELDVSTIKTEADVVEESEDTVVEQPKAPEKVLKVQPFVVPKINPDPVVETPKPEKVAKPKKEKVETPKPEVKVVEVTEKKVTKIKVARDIFLAETDRSIANLIKLYMDDIGVKKDMAYSYAKKITEEFELGKLK